jgi:hypothetical protein
MKAGIGVTDFGCRGLTSASTSVLSATGSLEISGASRCDDDGRAEEIARADVWRR